MMGRRPIGGIFSVGLEEPYRWKDSVQSEPEIRLWVAEGTANGMRPWVTKFSGVLYDRRWLPIGRAHLRLALPARALPAQRDAARARGAAALGADGDVSSRRRRRAIAPAITCSACITRSIEARVPFELVHEAFLTPDRLDRFKLLILADAAALSDAQCAAIRAYVERGGSVLATFASSLYDEPGRRRATSASPICSACRSPAASTGRCRTPI